jgi:hypothetical protein
MSGGGLMQLVAYGAQDVYLTSNPQVTLFKQLYRRHSNFAMESIEQTFNGVANFGKRVTCTISRNGDLIYRIYLQATLPSVSLVTADGSGGEFRWLNWVGHQLMNYIEVEIGGQKIDKHYGQWLHIWNELTRPAGKQAGYAEMVGNVPELVNTLTQQADGGCDSDCLGGEPHASNEDRSCAPEYTLYIPLQFWFNRHAGLALPLIALQYHEVKINIQFEELKNLCWSNVTGIIDRTNAAGLVSASLYVDYIYLDTEERRRFAQVAHEYLIEQLQFTGTESVTSTSNKIQLSFNHPCKEIVWVVQNPSYVDCNSSTNAPWRYTDSRLGNPTAVAKIQLNGQDRFTEREGSYFNFVQPYQHHTSTPATGINVYSFALKPEDLQPSGSCNFSRIDNAVLNLTLTPATFQTNVTNIAEDAVSGAQNSANVNIYATNYNVLRIMSGMGGLAYSN